MAHITPKRAAITALLTATVSVGGALVWISRRWIQPPRVRFQPPRSDRAACVQFPATDGVRLVGWLLMGEPGKPALILCHGYQRSMEETFSLGVSLRERGFTVLLFDFRGGGRSAGRYTTIGAHEPRDLLGAVRWLRSHLSSDTPIGVLGISMGGATAIRAAAVCPEIRAVVSDSSFAHLSGAVAHRFSTIRRPLRPLYVATMLIAERLCGGRVAQVRPVDAIGKIAPRPLLLIHGTDDGVVPYAQLHELLAAAGEPTTAWTLHGHRHAASRFHAAAEYVERVSAFFLDALSAA